MDKDLVERGLRAASSAHDRVNALIEAGVSAELISRVTGASPSSIRNWKTEIAVPRSEAADRLDILRSAMGQLVNRGLQPDDAAAWLQSRTDEPPHHKPIDILADNPDEVFEMIATEPFSE